MVRPLGAGVLRITYCAMLVAILAACQPAPEPTPQATAELPTDTPAPIPATLTPVPTRTPEPYPLATPEAFLPEGEMTPRLGANATLGKGVLLCDGRQWQSWWAPSMAKAGESCEGQAVPQHVPMLVWSPATFEEARARQTWNKYRPGYWLVFNECEHEGQCHTTPEEAARWYHDTGVPFARSLSPDTRLIVGGVNASNCGIDWLERFARYYRQAYGEDVPRAGWHFHIYPDVTAYDCTHPWQWNWPVLHDVDLFWQEWLDNANNAKRFVLEYGRPGDELWVSEASCLAPPPSICEPYGYTIAERMLAYYDNEGRYWTRFTWFADGGMDGYWAHLNLYDGNHEDGNLAIRPLGELWLGHEPLPAVPLAIYRKHFPILGFGADVIPAQPVPAVTPLPPAYP